MKGKEPTIPASVPKGCRLTDISRNYKMLSKAAFLVGKLYPTHLNCEKWPAEIPVWCLTTVAPFRLCLCLLQWPHTEAVAISVFFTQQQPGGAFKLCAICRFTVY